MGGKAPAARALPTSVTRAAGINLTKSLANEYAPDRILVNTICLGLVKSAQWERRAKGGDLEGYYRDAAKRVPVGRMGEAEEFADLVAFLASDRAALHHRHRDQLRRRNVRRVLEGDQGRQTQRGPIRQGVGLPRRWAPAPTRPAGSRSA